MRSAVINTATAQHCLAITNTGMSLQNDTQRFTLNYQHQPKETLAGESTAPITELATPSWHP